MSLRDIAHACDNKRRRFLGAFIAQVTPHLTTARAVNIEYAVMCEVFGLHHACSGNASLVEMSQFFVHLISSAESWRAYTGKMRSIAFNCCNSPSLVALPESKDGWLVTATHRDLWPERWQGLVVDSHIAPAFESTTSDFKCGKCKGRETTFYQMQTRSADEPMTLFIRCTTCGNRWKE